MSSRVQPSWCDIIIDNVGAPSSKALELFHYPDDDVVYWELGQWLFAVAKGRSCPLRVNKCWKRQVGFNFAVVAHALGHEPDIFILPSAKCIRDAGSELPPRIQKRAQDCWQVKTKGAVLLLVSFCRHRKHAQDKEAAYLHLLGLLRATHIEAGFDPSSLDDVMAEHTHLCTIGSTCGGLCGCLGRIRSCNQLAHNLPSNK